MSIKFGYANNYSSNATKNIIYEVINQQIQDNAAPILNRTINRRLRSYRNVLKADISLEFDFMEQDLVDDLFQTLHDGTIMSDLIFLPHPTTGLQLDYLNKTAGSSSPNPNYVYYGTTSDPDQAPSTGAEISQANYNNIEYWDGSVYNQATGIGNYAHIWFYFNLTAYLASNSKENIRRMLLLHTGMDDDLLFSIWNPENSVWVDLLDTADEGIAATNDVSLISSLPLDRAFRDFDEFIDGSNIVIFRARSKSIGDVVRINYVSMFINGFHVIPEDPIVDLNFRDQFDGAGRRGTLTLAEV